MNNDSSDEIKEITAKVNEFIATELREGAMELSVASCLMVGSLRLYRTVLDDESYNLLIENILTKRDEIKPFKVANLQ